VARLHLSDAEAEPLTVWIAQRVGRAQPLAGDRGPFGRLEHVVRHWLSEGERSALLCWLLAADLARAMVSGGGLAD
jgi:hypothetical protein